MVPAESLLDRDLLRVDGLSAVDALGDLDEVLEDLLRLDVPGEDDGRSGLRDLQVWRVADAGGVEGCSDAFRQAALVVFAVDAAAFGRDLGRGRAGAAFASAAGAAAAAS